MKTRDQLSIKGFFFQAISQWSPLIITGPSHRIRLGFLALAFTVSLLLLAGVVVTPATAMTIQYSFTGTVNQVTPRLSSTFSTSPISSAMSGLMTLNTADSNPLNANIGSYTITNFSLTIERYTATMGTSGNIQIRNGPPGNDQFNVTANAPNGPTVSSLAPRIFEIQLRGPNSLFTSDALPTSSPSITSFTNRNLWRLVFAAGTNRTVSGVITAVTAVAVVPLPPTVILFGTALVALVGLGAGNWKQRKASPLDSGQAILFCEQEKRSADSLASFWEWGITRRGDSE